VVALAVGDETPISGRHADLLSPELPGARELLGDQAVSEEDVVTAAIFPQLTEQYLRIRDHGGEDPAQFQAALAAVAFDVQERNQRVAEDEAGPGKGVNPWKMAGRWEITRARA